MACERWRVLVFRTADVRAVICDRHEVDTCRRWTDLSIQSLTSLRCSQTDPLRKRYATLFRCEQPTPLRLVARWLSRDNDSRASLRATYRSVSVILTTSASISGP